MKEVYVIYSGLNNIQNELKNFPKKVKLKNKNLISENTYDFSEKLNESKNLLDEYNTRTAKMFFDEAKIIKSKIN